MWLSQHVRGSGEIAMQRRVKNGDISQAQYDSMLSNEESKVQLLVNDNYCAPLISIILNTPVEYGMSGITGFNYRALEKRIKWATPKDYDLDDVEQLYEPIILSLGSHYISEINKKQEK